MICWNMLTPRLRDFLIASAWLALSMALTGDHVCHRVENYTVNLRERYEEPVEVYTFRWCLQIPPRCPKTFTELRERWRTRADVKFKSVAHCCDGYVKQEVQGDANVEAKCVPHCKKCLVGVCVAPNKCQCKPGFHGDDCEYECPLGSWGKNCTEKCVCELTNGCNSTDGKCTCPPGWIGSRCDKKCPLGQWGSDCASECTCESSAATCHHETGECADLEAPTGQVPALNNWTMGEPFEASGVPVNAGASTVTPKSNTDYEDIIDDDKEILRLQSSTERGESSNKQDVSISESHPSFSDDVIPVRNTVSMEETFTKSLDDKTYGSTIPFVPKQTPGEGYQLPEPEDVRQNTLDFDERSSNFRIVPKTEFVKTTNTASTTTISTIPIDLAAMIAVGAIICIGLTTVAALMIFHMRSRLLKAAISIYNQEKIEAQYPDKMSISGKSATLTLGTLSRMSNLDVVPRANSGFEPSLESGSAVLTFDDQPNDYANGTVTIGIRLSSNLRDLLESHYDRPASCARKCGTTDADVEHVYAEIPLTAPFYFGKDT